MKEYAKSKAKRDDNHCLENTPCNDEGHTSKAAEEKFKTFYTETSTRRRELKEQLEIVRAKKEGKLVLINKVYQVPFVFG